MIGLLALATVSIHGCPIENAIYVLRHTPDVTAFFKPVDRSPDWPGGLAWGVHSKKTGKTSWWLPWNGGSDNLQNIASTTDVAAEDWRPPNPDGGPRPLGNREFLSMDANYNIIDEIPQRGRLAPAHILIPDAGSSQDRVFVAKQFFDLASCTGTGG